MSEFIHVDDSNFDDIVLNSDVPVVVEFGAEWCVPCKRMEPVLLEIASQNGDKVKLGKVDVDKSVNLTMRFQVMGVPTIFVFIDGEIKERMVGAQPRNRIVKKIGAFL